MEKKTLYLECRSGISGDMTVAALLDLGADQAALEEALASLPVEGFRTKVGRVKKAGLDVCDFDVILDREYENHDHDMEYLHGHSHEGQVHEHVHGHDHEGHTHEHGHGEHTHGHEHRGLKEILHLIDHAKMSDRAKATAARIFDILADAEAEAHGVPKDQVHFHEVGAVDSIVDILSVAFCLDNLGITDVVVPELHDGHGLIRCQHGIIPVPVPATLNIVTAHHVPLHIANVEGELVTPTGAAIVAAIRTKERLPEHFTIEKVGLGAGKRNYEVPGILRAMLISPSSEEKDTIWKLETNIDDCSGEALGYTLERLMEAGARDAHYTPVFMKKNRPAYQLDVICSEEDVARMEEIIFRETTTIGIRKVKMERAILKREIVTVQTPYGDAKVKKCVFHDKVSLFPEYESVAELCRKTGKSYIEMYQIVQREANT